MKVCDVTTRGHSYMLVMHQLGNTPLCLWCDNLGTPLHVCDVKTRGHTCTHTMWLLRDTLSTCRTTSSGHSHILMVQQLGNTPVSCDVLTRGHNCSLAMRWLGDNPAHFWSYDLGSPARFASKALDLKALDELPKLCFTFILTPGCGWRLFGGREKWGHKPSRDGVCIFIHNKWLNGQIEVCQSSHKFYQNRRCLIDSMHKNPIIIANFANWSDTTTGPNRISLTRWNDIACLRIFKMKGSSHI